MLVPGPIGPKPTVGGRPANGALTTGGRWVPSSESRFINTPPKIERQFKSSNFCLREIWVSDPGTGPIGFVSKFRAVSLYLWFRNSDVDAEQTQIDFWDTPSKNSLKPARILLGHTPVTRTLLTTPFINGRCPLVLLSIFFTERLPDFLSAVYWERKQNVGGAPAVCQ